jgi:hypothetical protein
MPVAMNIEMGSRRSKEQQWREKMKANHGADRHPDRQTIELGSLEFSYKYTCDPQQRNRFPVLTVRALGQLTAR